MGFAVGGLGKSHWRHRAYGWIGHDACKTVRAVRRLVARVAVLLILRLMDQRATMALLEACLRMVDDRGRAGRRPQQCPRVGRSCRRNAETKGERSKRGDDDVLHCSVVRA